MGRSKVVWYRVYYVYVILALIIANLVMLNIWQVGPKHQGYKREVSMDMKSLNVVEVISIRKLEGAGNLKAFVDIRVGGGLVITQCAVLDGKRGLFATMPRQLARDGRWRDVVIVADEKLQKLYADTIVKAYEEEVAQVDK